jgi:hypothetical protein
MHLDKKKGPGFIREFDHTGSFKFLKTEGKHYDSWRLPFCFKKQQEQEDESESARAIFRFPAQAGP